MNWRASSAGPCSSAGISPYSNFMPCEASSQWMAFIFSRSTTPLKLSSAPIGSCIGTATAPSLAFSWPTTFWKLAPVRSILLTNAMRGTWYLLAWRHTVSDCGCTPPTAHRTKTAPSSTRSERSTSMVKSTCPGVSMMLKRCSGRDLSMPFQNAVVAADWIVMPRSCSCSIQSMVAAPSCTSPILWLLPV